MRSLHILAVLLLTATVGHAQERVWLGSARVLNNDQMGDGKDRWRTGSYSASFIRGTVWNGALPERLGELVEYRFRSEIIAPANLQNPVIGTDRRYVGALHFGAFTHVKAAGGELALGFDLVATGPQTGLGQFQSWAHNAVGMATPAVLGTQIGDAFYPTISAEFGRDFTLSSANERRISFRPFVAAQAGIENFLRIGGDFTFGNMGLGDFQVRDQTTGQRGIAIKSTRARGLSFLAGGDVAFVQSSQYLPASSGYRVQTARVRLRAGLYHEGRKGSIFYGLTWLGKEFVNQPTTQVLGSLSIRMTF
ncbi:MAG: lipid A deacylase LpxR family protein [Alphaproteobacteria bacterium]|nr:lipid A deacylase LpxR family protein [Alphaproteobacteria bacterium]